MKNIGGIANILGKSFAFPNDEGYGLIRLGDQLALVEYSCPLESLPPKGSGNVLTTTGIPLKLENGKLTYNGVLVSLGEEI